MVDAGYRASMEQQIFVVMERMIYEIEQTPQDKFTLIVDNADLSYWKLVHYQCKFADIYADLDSCINLETC